MARRPARSTIDQFLRRVSAKFDGLSRQFQDVARFLERQRERVGILGVQELARQCGVQPSTIVRFAQRFGFSGFSDMQSVFREGLSRRLSASGAAAKSWPKRGGADWFEDYLTQRAADLREVGATLDGREIDKAAAMIVEAEAIWILNGAPSPAIAEYLGDALRRAGQRIMLLPARESIDVAAIRRGDVLVAIGGGGGDARFLQATARAKKMGCRCVAILEGGIGKLGAMADARLSLGKSRQAPRRSGARMVDVMEALLLATERRKSRQPRRSARRSRST